MIPFILFNVVYSCVCVWAWIMDGNGSYKEGLDLWHQKNEVTDTGTNPRSRHGWTNGELYPRGRSIGDLFDYRLYTITATIAVDLH